MPTTRIATQFDQANREQRIVPFAPADPAPTKPDGGTLITINVDGPIPLGFTQNVMASIISAMTHASPGFSAKAVFDVTITTE